MFNISYGVSSCVWEQMDTGRHVLGEALSSSLMSTTQDVPLERPLFFLTGLYAIIPSTGDQCSQLIVATLVPSTPICLFFNLASLQCKQTVVTDFCIGFVNKIHIIGKGMIKETWIAKIKEIGCWTEELITFCPFFARFRVVWKASKFCGQACRLELRLSAWRAMNGSTHRRKQRGRPWHKTIFLILANCTRGVPRVVCDDPLFES